MILGPAESSTQPRSPRSAGEHAAQRCQHRGIVLIFDEVITGIRWSRGGAQARYDITPDLSVLAKILAGGLPAAAVATLDLVETSDACARAKASAEALRQGLRELLVEEGVPWGVYGEPSVFIVFPNPKGLPIDPASVDPVALGFEGIKGARDAHLINRLRLALLVEGVDIMGGPGGMVSATHGPQEVAQILQAFRSALRRLKAQDGIRGL